MARIRKADEWDAVKERALDYIFAGRFPQAKVAALVGTTTRTIERWVASPAFQQRLEAKRADLAAALASVTYADKTRRIIALNEMAESARVEYEAHPLLKEVRPTPAGDVTNENFNRDAFESFRGALDDIAKEMGQRKAAPDVQVNIVQAQVFHDDPEAAELTYALLRRVASRGGAPESGGPRATDESDNL